MFLFFCYIFIISRKKFCLSRKIKKLNTKLSIKRYVGDNFTEFYIDIIKGNFFQSDLFINLLLQRELILHIIVI